MKRYLAGFLLIMIMSFNLVYIFDSGSSINEPLSNVSINNLRGNEFQGSDNTIQGNDAYVNSKTSDIPSGWSYESIINLNPITSEADYQVKVILTTDNFDYTQANSDGSDIRFQDLANNPLSYWIESWNENGKSIIWVKIPVVGTDSFYMNYGNPNAISASNGDATFLFFDDFSGTTIDSGKWWTETDTYSTMSISEGIISLSSETPLDNAPSVHLGFSDFHVLHGQGFGAIAANGISLGRSYGPSNTFFIRNITNSGMEQIDNVYNYEEWYTTDIRWVSNSLAQFNNGSGLVTHTNSTTFPTTPLQVRILTMDMYAGPGTWFGQAIQSIGTWGAGHAIRARSWHDGVGAPEIKCDWLLVRKCAQVEPAATVVNDDVTITSPQAKNYAAAMQGHYPASYGFESDPSFPYGNGSTPELLTLSLQPPEGWIPHYPGQTGKLGVIDEYMGHTKVVELRKSRGSFGKARTGMLKYFPTSATAGTVEFWLNKNSDTGLDATKFILTGTGGTIEFGIENQALYRGVYTSRVNISEYVFPQDTWKHISVDFDIGQGGWQIQLDGTMYGVGYTFPFEGSPSEITGFDIRSHGSEFQTGLGVYDFYFDALGYSWDPGYTIGDNLNEGLLLDFDPITRSRTDWQGYYPSSEGYDDIPEGGQPNNWGYWQGGSAYSENIPAPEMYVIDSKTDSEGNTHTKVLYCKDNSGGTVFNGDGYWDEPRLSGSVEFWVLNQDSSNYRVMWGLLSEHFDGWGWGTARVSQEYNEFEVWDGTTVINTGISFVDNKWYRISIDFSDDGTYAGLSPHHYRARLYDSDATTLLYASPDLKFQFNGSSLAFHVVTGDSSRANVYVDAIGYSWDPNYELEDNSRISVYEGPELAELSWMGYSLDGQPNVTISGATTMVMPLAGEHTIQLFMNDSYSNWYSSTESFLTEQITLVTPETKNYAKGMNTYFPGTYGFENEAYNTFGLDIDFIDEYYSSHPVSSYVFFATRPSRPVADHFNVLNLVDAQGSGWCWGVHNFESPPTAGTVEFLLMVTGTAGTHYFELRAANDLPAIEMRATFSGSKLQYFDGSVWQDISDLIVNQWFHHSITFDCEAGVNGQFSWIVTYENGTEFDRVDNIEFQNDLNTLDELYLGTTVADYQIGTWWDAFGFSWEGYTPGDNFNPGLLLSFDTPTTFDWTGYSLDGGANVTIRGNVTLDLPATGTHTIQLFGNDSSGNYYKSLLREFKVRTINIDTPKDMTYSTSMEGYYPATYGFENDIIGTVPAGWFAEYDGNGYIETVAELDGHKKVVHIRKDGGVVWTKLQKNFTVPVTTGQVEFWLYKDTDSGVDPTFVMMQNTIYTEGSLLCHFENTNFYYSYDSLGDRVLVATGIYSANEWIHASIDFDTAIGWQITINGILYGDGYSLPFHKYATGGALYEIRFASLFSGGVTNYGAWVDALGYSWDPGYTVGDNLNEGLLLGCTYDSLKENHYPGTYSFDTDLNGEFPAGFYGESVTPHESMVIEEFNGHSKVLRVYDGGDAGWNLGHYMDVTEGTAEFWMASSTIGTNQPVTFGFHPQSIDPILFGVGLHEGNIHLYDIGGTPYGTIIGTYNVNSWQHFRVDFRTNSSTTEYLGLNPNQFIVWLNGTSIGTYDFQADGDLFLTRLYSLYTGGGWTGYYDAIGYSWDPDYNIRDNFFEGVINSHGTQTPLEWMGYSLDGQANVTIYGNHTIPMPTNGIHTIQVVGFDYLGNYYKSDERSYQIEVIPPAPPTISGSSDFSLNYGDPGYFILWTANDPFPSNYTIYLNNTVFGADDWVTTNIIASCDGLEEGKHNFTCVVQNTWDLKSSDEVWITVLPMTPDITLPVISSPDDITFEEGSIGYTIIWSGSDDRSPWWASVEKDSSNIYSQAWIGNDIEIDLSGLAIGIYDYNCTLSDEAGNHVFDIVTVTVIAQVPDVDPPIITAPSPLTYEVGTTGNTLTWICFEDHPLAYDVFINNTATGYVESLGYYAWHGENITYAFDGLAEGNWEAILILYDLSSNNATSIITITVIPPIPDTTPPTVSTPADIIVAENMAGTIIWEVDDAHPGNFIITQNGTQIFSQNHWVSGIIQYHFASLPLGTYYFTLTCWDEAENSASGMVIVKVLTGSQVDTSPPLISHHPNVEINYGETGNVVIFHLFDVHPAGYQVSLIQGNIILNNPNWITPNIELEISLDNLDVGSYSLNITAWDLFGNSDSQIISVSVIGDVNPPEISSPADIKGYANHTIIITWTISDQNLSHCEVLSLPTGNIINRSDPFSGTEFVFTTKLPVGTYKYRLVVYDLSGNFAFDDVEVTIIPVPGGTPGFELVLLIPVLIIIAMFRTNVVSRRRLKK